MSNPSLLCVPYRFKTSKLYSQIPDSGLGDFVVTRATTPTAGQATRVNAAGLIELVADNVPRLDYPLGGITAGCPALLVEPSAQNLALQSAAFNTTWTISNSTQITTNTTGTTDPAGSTLSDLIFCQASGTLAQGVNQSISISTSGTYTMSVFVKKASNFDWFRIQFQDATATAYQAYYNLVSGTLGAVDAGSTATITSFGNGWYRVTHSRTTVTGNVVFGLRLANANSTLTVPCDGISGAYIFGAQLEVGSVATSYIPTAASPVTRGAETISKTGVSSLIGQTEGTIYAEVDVRNRLNGTAVLTLAKDAGVSSRVIIYTNTNNQWRANYTDASGTIVDTSAANNTQVLGVNKLALAYGAGGNATLHCNGSLIITLSGTSTFVQDLQAIFLGSSNGGALFFNNRILAAELYPTRLTNAQLQSLTQ
jgi:hypothetical protein